MNPQPATPENLDQRVMELITRHQGLRPGQVTIDSTFANLGVSSFDAMELILEFEETFHVSVPDDIGKYVRSVRDVVGILRERLSSPAPVA